MKGKKEAGKGEEGVAIDGQITSPYHAWNKTFTGFIFEEAKGKGR